MYRAITYLALQNQIDIQAEEPLVALCVNHTISFQQAENGQRSFIDGHEVTEAIRQPDVTNAVSAVSNMQKLEKKWWRYNRKLVKPAELSWMVEILVLQFYQRPK